LLIDPSIPAEWDGFTVERTYRGCHLTIKVENPDHIQHGVKEIRVDGKRIDRENVPLLTDIILSGRTNASIQVTMGS
jgi:cellobiose phosphorylase